jgi:2-amino-4-hydroxy-6-hydroxymethyldihydropteridine diphosphokinase
MNEVYILGGGRTDFKRNLKKEGKTIRHIIIEAGKKAIDDAKIDPGEIQAGAVGNFNAGQFTKQLQLGAFIPEIDPKLRGIPTMHTEAACASGALSVLLGAEWIMGGFYDVVLVVGAEQQKTMSSLDGADVLGAAADYHNEKPEYGDFMFPKLFGRFDYEDDPANLLEDLMRIEETLGRRRDHPKNVSRTIDIDLLYCGDRKIEDERLQLPHPRLHLRKFVVQPLTDIRSDLVLLGQAKTVRQLLEELKDSAAVVRFADNW